MKLSRVIGVVILSMTLMSGCTLVQTPGETAKPADPSPSLPIAAPSALELKLDAMSQRLDRMEQTLASAREHGQRQRRWEDQMQQSLHDLRRDLRNTHRTMTRIQQQMKSVRTQPSAPNAPLGESVGKLTPFWAVDVLLGELPNGGSQRETRHIPALVPDKAREILVYAQIATGYVKGGAHRFRIAVQAQSDQEAAFYLYAVGQPQPGWSYNSDNVWLPMPKNRELILQAEGEPFFGDWKSEVRIVGYR